MAKMSKRKTNAMGGGSKDQDDDDELLNEQNSFMRGANEGGNADALKKGKTVKTQDSMISKKGS